MSLAHHKFKFWPRYVSRLLRLRMDYRGDLMGWKISGEPNTFVMDDQKKDEWHEKRFRPLWRLTEEPPWNVANRISEFIFPDLTWNVEYPDGSVKAGKLTPLPIEEQIIFKGDRVQVLVGPDKGKIGLVASVIKQRRLVLVEGLNTLYQWVNEKNIQRKELPLHLDTEVALVDPGDGRAGPVEWRYLAEGNKVRVALRTGRQVPLPASADQLDDLTTPATTTSNAKDMLEDELVKVTFKPTRGRVDMFEEDVAMHCGIDYRRRDPGRTFWY